MYRNYSSFYLDIGFSEVEKFKGEISFLRENFHFEIIQLVNDAAMLLNMEQTAMMENYMTTLAE